MQRRHLLAGFATLGGLFSLSSSARAAGPDKAPDKSKVVYHLCDMDKVAFTLGNIQNHYDGVGGPEKVNIALVVHGPALKAFHSISASPDTSSKLEKYIKTGLTVNACGNTMKAQGVTQTDLLPGMVKVDEGGVVKLAELQSQGYVYLKP